MARNGTPFPFRGNCFPRTCPPGFGVARGGALRRIRAMSKPAVIALVFVLGGVVGYGIHAVREPSEPAPLASKSAAPAPDQVEARATEILRGADPVARIRELGNLLESLGPDAAPALVSAFDAAP